MGENIIPHTFNITRESRVQRNGHPSTVVWFTGLSGSGKSTIANLVEKDLFDRNIQTFSLDGDNIRNRLNNDLDFTEKDRKENLRRIAEVAKLFVEGGNIVIASFVSPLISDRKYVKSIIGNKDFIEVFVNTSLEECERRDVKGLYKKAREGKIPNFTGISAPYQEPINPDLVVKTENEDVQTSVKKVFEYLVDKLEISR